MVFCALILKRCSNFNRPFVIDTKSYRNQEIRGVMTIIAPCTPKPRGDIVNRPDRPLKAIIFTTDIMPACQEISLESKMPNTAMKWRKRVTVAGQLKRVIGVSQSTTNALTKVLGIANESSYFINILRVMAKILSKAQSWAVGNLI